MHKTRISFLLGAGVSLPAGVPSTESITNEVLTEIDQYELHSSERFYKPDQPLPPGNQNPRWLAEKPRLTQLLTFLPLYIGKFFTQEKERFRPVNYEDVYYAVRQISDHLCQEYENPVLEEFVQYLRRELIIERDQLQNLLKLACRYIQDAVACIISRVSPNLGHLACLLEAVGDEEFAGVDIFTLNHDLLIETVLKRGGIRYVDGFGAADGELRDWDPDQFSRPARCYFLKLHGSVNWYRYRDRRAVLTEFSGKDVVHALDAQNRMWAYPSDDVRVLMGTFNKFLEYFREPFFTLMYVLRRQLAQSRYLIVSGYSFGDKGVNTVLVNWMSGDPSRKLILLHEAPQSVRERARGAIRMRWRENGLGSIVEVPMYLSECEWPTLKERIVGLR